MVLNYASVGEAFILGSDQIKNTQLEIAKLKELLLDSNITQEQSKPPVQNVTQPVFKKESPDFNETLSNLIQHPKFDDIVRDYLKSKYPGYTLTETVSSFGTNPDIIKFLVVCLFIYLILNLIFQSRPV